MRHYAQYWFFVVWLLSTLCLYLGSPCLVSADESKPRPPVQIILSGKLDETLQSNILKRLSLNQLKPTQTLSPFQFLRFYQKIEAETAEALEPFGFYSPEISKSYTQHKQRWEVQLEVQPGSAVRVDEIYITFTGPGQEDKALQRRAKKFPLKTGDILNHQSYTDGKDKLITTAMNRGYLKASFQQSRVEVRKQARTAVITLQLETGLRYRFGPITYDTEILNEELLRKITPIKEGDPLSPLTLARLRQGLFTSEYFTQVDLDYNLDNAVGDRVPVRVQLTPNLAHKYGVGLGYGTDTGARGTLSYSNRYLNRYGHQLELRTQPAEWKSEFNSVYSIPVGDPMKERLSLRGNYQVEDLSWIDSELWTASVRHEHFYRRGEYSTNLKFLDERYTTGLDNGHATLLMPELTGTLYWANDRLKTNKGIRLSGSIFASREGFVADATLIEATVQCKGIYRIGEKWRFISRADIGGILTEDIHDVPHSLRFYAGGDQSVRGYGYKEIGPTDAEGNVIGGKNLLVYSLELERVLFGDWSGAVFYDSGTATNDFSELSMRSGAGIGIRWNAPFGQLRLDLAKALDEDGNCWRIHFTMGADL